MSSSLDNMTLREKMIEADKLVRELMHHLEHGFVPKAHRLRRVARHGADPSEQEHVTDLTIRSTVDDVLQSDEFTRNVAHQLMQFLTAIDRDVRKLLGIED
jgi:hypothetical protein